jgi:hypothetical protein
MSAYNKKLAKLMNKRRKYKKQSVKWEQKVNKVKSTKVSDICTKIYNL